MNNDDAKCFLAIFTFPDSILTDEAVKVLNLCLGRIKAEIALEFFLTVSRKLTVAGQNLFIAAVGPQFPCLGVVGKIGSQIVIFEIFPDRRPVYRRQDLDAAVQISRHPVGTSHVNFVIAAVLEIIDPAMLKQTPDNTSDPDIL